MTAAPAQFLSTDAFVTAAAFSGGMAALSLGDGTVRLVAADGTEKTVNAHDGSAMSLTATQDGFVSVGDDGRAVAIATNGETREIFHAKGKWIEHVAYSPASGALVVAGGKEAFAIVKPGTEARKLSHGSSVMGLVFDPKGKRIAAAHYNGVSLWWPAAENPSATLLEWKGSHTGVVWHPGGDFVVTSMQENALHGWRLSDKQHMRMAGYPAKPKSLVFFAKGKWLGTSGAESVVCWPFDGKGPMGKSAREVGPQGSICTMLAAHPGGDLLASGHADGSIWITRFENDQTANVRAPAGEPVSALAWRSDGHRLAFGCEDGAAGVMNFEPVAR
jgi:WD40 repeat protein